MNSLRQARKAKKWTLKNLSDMCGMTIAHLSWMERGKMIPTIITRVRLEMLLNERIDFLHVPNLNIEPLNPPADWNACEREFRFLLKMIKSLPVEERNEFCVTAGRHIRKLRLKANE